MAPATEVASLPMKEGQDTDDFSSASGQKFKELLDTVASQPGCQRIHYGRAVENPSMLNLFIDWDSIDAHKNFIASPQYTPFFAAIGSMLGGSPHLCHVHFDQSPSPALSGGSPIKTEFITVLFPKDYSSADQEKYHSDILEFRDKVAETAEGFLGAYGGWAEEELDDPKDSEKSKAYVMLIGWTSVEAHMKYRETQSFKDNIHLLRGGKDLKNATVCHVAAKEFQK